MPVNWDDYPVEWREMALIAKQLAGFRCELCGMLHMGDGTMGSCLTVHHPDHDPGNPNARLEALCARCHLREERLYRYRNQMKLFTNTNHVHESRI